MPAIKEKRVSFSALDRHRRRLPHSQPRSQTAARRVRVVVDFNPEEPFSALEAHYACEPHTLEIFVAEGRSAHGCPRERRVRVESEIALVNRQLASRRCDVVVFVRHASIGAAEIADAVDRLAESGTGLYFLIPGLNELLTLGFAALTAYDTSAGHAKYAQPPIAARLKQRVAPHLPRQFKNAVRYALSTFGLLSPLGLEQGSKTAPGEAARISTQASVAGVLATANPAGLPHTYSLGSRELQRVLFVEQVARHFPLPRTISLVLSNQCNLKCVMCPYHSPLFIDNRKTDYFDDKRWLPVGLVERLVEELRRVKPAGEPIVFHMGELDEPLLHPDVARIVKLLAGVPGANVHITSNGNLLTERLARDLIEAGLNSVQFSVDAQTQKTYQEIRGAKLEKVQRNVGRFLKLRDELRPDLYVNLCIINQRGATKEIEDFKAYWREKGASSVSVYQLFVPSTDNSAKWVAPNKYYEEKKRMPCTALWDQCFIYPEGEVSLCCTTLGRVPQDGIISVGNFRNWSLQEIWFGEAYQRIRENLIYERFDDQKYCEECDNWSSSYQYRKELSDGTVFIYGESMGYYFFPRPATLPGRSA